VQQPSHPSMDLGTAAAVSGIFGVLLGALKFIPPIRRWFHQRELARVRRLVAEAFAAELRRGEQSAAEIAAVFDRLDRVEDAVTSNAELLAQIPLLVKGHERIERALDETRDDVKKILFALGQVDGRSRFGELKP
jgi:septal ring factor EnvC (AmiA/AmiB activator)